MLRSLKGQRTRLHNKIKEELVQGRKLVDRGVPLVGSVGDLRSEVEAQISVLGQFRDRFDTLSGQIMQNSEGRSDEDLDQESELVIDVTSDVTRSMASLSAFLSKLDRQSIVSESSTESSQGLASIQQKIDKLVELQTLQLSPPDMSSTGLSEPSPSRGSQFVRLPKLEFEKFSGDVLKFQEFWDSFEAAIHSNSCLRPVEKLNYLRAYLSGEAKQVISGVSTCDANYDVAVELVRKRFGNSQASIDAHYSRLTNYPPAPNHTSKLRALLDEIEKHLRCLAALGEDVEHRHFISLIMTKLPKDVLIRVEESKDDSEIWSVNLLRKKLNSLLTARECAERQHLSPQHVDDRNGSRVGAWSTPARSSTTTRGSHTATVEGLVAGERSQAKTNAVTCALCGRGHFNDQCQKYKSAEERRRCLRGRCYICLSRNHQSPQCPSTKACFHCRQVKKHNRCLCPVKFSKPSEASAITAEDPADDRPGGSVSIRSPDPASQHTVLASGDRVLLQTALVEVKNPDAPVRVSTRVLLDCASNRSYISSSLAETLQLRSDKSESFSVVTFGSEKPKTVKTSVTQIQMFQKNGSSRILDVNVVPKITGMIHRSPVEFPVSSFLWKDLPLADVLPTESESSPVDFLIGNDYYLDVITSEKIEVGKGLYLLGSQLGWILTGRIENTRSADQDMSLFVNSFVNQGVQSLNAFTKPDPCLPISPSFDDFWRLESIGIVDNPDATDNDRALTQFNSTVKIVDGRYQVTWPWKDASPNLPDNYQLSLGRLKSLLRKFGSNPDLLKKYSDIIKDQEEKGIIESVDPDCDDGPYKHYIPHHPVVTPNKSTTKVRIVYDASSKIRKGVNSLNDCLLRGPIILEDLCGLLLRFRLFPVAVVSDIEKAFLQVGLQTPDRDVTRFLWLQNPKVLAADGNIQIFRFCRIPFGVISSPFMLGATVKYHLMKSESPVAAKIRENLYVDNVITGVSSLQEALEFYREAKSIFKDASMNIRECTSNCLEFLKDIPDSDKVKSSLVKVLGMNWDTREDSISINCSSSDLLMSASTKRQMFQALASVFDPLGFFSPITVRAKIFIHRLWTEKNDWDSKLSPNFIGDWKAIAQELIEIPVKRFPRFIGTSNAKTSSVELFCFCDASALAYAAVVYAKVTSSTSTEVHLLFAKSRLAPAKSLSIPRLELLAVVIGVRCLKFVEEQLRLPIKKKILWTDSQCVLHWLGSSKMVTVFVENRLREVRKSTDISYRYVSGRENPADVATRGQFSCKELNSSAWWTGPVWTKKDERSWPVWTYDLCPSSLNEEVLPAARTEDAGLLSHTAAKVIPPYQIQIDRYSSLIRLYRVTAWITRFIDKVGKRISHSGNLDGAEIIAAKLAWDRHIQEKSFPDVNDAIETGRRCNLKEQLNVRKGGDDVLRCYGRFAHADLPDDVKFPKLLPRNGQYTDLVIRHFHIKLLHASVSHTLSQIRLEYWIPQGRSAVRRVLSHCLTCRRWDGGPYQLPLMPPLPASRISKSAPFSYVGLDYLGPLRVKTRVHETQKIWVCLFTCMAVRAIHLELVDDLSADQFLLCLRRFIARRGKPIQVLSDNATQFKLSKVVLERLWGDVISDPEVVSYVSSEGISWKFIVERAPWMGGFYERLVGSVKRALKRGLGRLCLTFIQLNTALTEVEAVINSRPLFSSGDDILSYAVITPNHFLSLNPRSGIPIMDFGSQQDPPFLPEKGPADVLLTTWKKGHKLLDQFWNSWSEDYLASLRERSHFRHKVGRIVSPFVPDSGDVVLVKEDNRPRGSWVLGRVSRLIESQDGQVRAASVKLPSGNTVNRPIKLLYPLECNTNQKIKSQDVSKDISQYDKEVNITQNESGRVKRKAAVAASANIREWIEHM